ncbi:ATP-binding protein [Streptomyces sp. NPDC088752]|uniref:ATP-binding protein n=1 Tax=Streptomyces sp. NPDC088752 TaxID=3154963 RepID=UPI003448566D
MHSLFRPPPAPLGASIRRLPYRRTYDGLDSSVPAARADFAEAAAKSGLDPAVADVVLLGLSELATNAVRHAERRFTVVTAIRGPRCPRVRLEVHDTCKTRIPAFPDDGGGALDFLAALDGDAVGGRGLAMIAAFADRTGVTEDPNGKTVWFEVRLPGATR